MYTTGTSGPNYNGSPRPDYTMGTPTPKRFSYVTLFVFFFFFFFMDKMIFIKQEIPKQPQKEYIRCIQREPQGLITTKPPRPNHTMGAPTLKRFSYVTLFVFLWPKRFSYTKSTPKRVYKMYTTGTSGPNYNGSPKA